MSDSEINLILNQIDGGDHGAAERLLPLVYDELRKLASAKLEHERPGQTLQATALVHEAYLRLVGDQHFENRRHFFAAAAEAMRRVLVDNARRRHSLKRGVDWQRVDVDVEQLAAIEQSDSLLALDIALERLQDHDREMAELVKRRYFTGMTIEQTAESLGISVTTANRWWAYARAWLHDEMQRCGG